MLNVLLHIQHLWGFLNFCYSVITMFFLHQFNPASDSTSQTVLYQSVVKPEVSFRETDTLTAQSKNRL